MVIIMKAVRLKIYGRVQGVFFRLSAKKVAKKLAIHGWVRNAPDGTVEILAQGQDQELQKFTDWCHRGPFLAKVDKVEILPQDSLENQQEFKIIR
jgi:acylphosphatase